MRADKGQTCGSVAVSHGHQAADGPLPALFGRHVEHTLHLQETTATTSTQPSTPSKCLHQVCSKKIQADAAETDGCNNVPKTPGGSSDTPQSRLVSERRTQAAATRGRSVRGEAPGRKWRRRRRRKGEKRGKEMDGGRGWISLCSCEMSLQSIKHSGWTDEPIRPS